ncbi:MAG: xylulokinase [Lachnospiraceae bacterium]
MTNHDTSYVIGMDCGTTNLKAVLLSAEGKIIARASRPSEYLHPGPLMQEQNAQGWWKRTVEIIRELLGSIEEADRYLVKGICISSHTVTLLPVDKDGVPLRNALTYQDGRSAGELQEIVNTIGNERFVTIVGGQPSTAFLPNKLKWFKEKEPQLFERTACFLQASSYLNFKLTGIMSMDLDQAGRTQCLDINTLKWSQTIGDAIGIDLDNYLPKLYQVDDIVGTVNKEAAVTGLSEGTVVLAGCSDAMASMYATGLSRLKEAAESSGTTSLVFVGSDQKSASNVPVVTRTCGVSGMPWIFDAPIQTSGATLKWFLELLGEEEKKHAQKHGIDVFEYLNTLALESNAGSGGLIFFPYLLGERAPLWNDHAKGMFIGLDLDTKRSDLIRSIFEGTSFALRHVLETVAESGAHAKLLRICGGGAKSRTWSQIKASVLHMPVYLLDEESGDVPVGDALIAGCKFGLFADLSEAVEKVVKIKEVIQPVAEWEKMYDTIYPFYLSMYQHLDEDLRKLKNAMDQSTF